MDILKRFANIVDKQKQIFAAKNHDYAAGGHWDGNFSRVSKILQLYPGLSNTRRAVLLVYLLKQLDCILWGEATGLQKKVEGLEERANDVAVYMNIYRLMLDEDNAKKDERYTDKQIAKHKVMIDHIEELKQAIRKAFDITTPPDPKQFNGFAFARVLQDEPPSKTPFDKPSPKS